MVGHSESAETHRGVGADQERGHGVRPKHRLLPAVVEAAFSEMDGTDGRPEPRVPGGAAHHLHPLSQ